MAFVTVRFTHGYSRLTPIGVVGGGKLGKVRVVLYWVGGGGGGMLAALIEADCGSLTVIPRKR